MTLLDPNTVQGGGPGYGGAGGGNGLLSFLQSPMALNLSLGLLAGSGPHRAGQNRYATVLDAMTQAQRMQSLQARDKIATEEATRRRKKDEAEEAQRRGQARALGPYSPGAGGVPWTNPDTGQVQYGGLLDRINATPQQRAGLAALPPEQAAQFLTQQLFQPPPERWETEFDDQGRPLSQRSTKSGKVASHPAAPKAPSENPAEQRLYEWAYGDKAPEMWARDQEAKRKTAGQLTPAQTSNNDEIAAARSYLMGISPEGLTPELIDRMTSAELRGRRNPDYNPLFDQAFRRANQKMVGTDSTWEIWNDWAGFRGGRGQAPADQRSGGGIIGSAAAAEPEVERPGLLQRGLDWYTDEARFPALSAGEGREQKITVGGKEYEVIERTPDSRTRVRDPETGKEGWLE